MADTFISHLEWTGAAKGPTNDPATFSRDLAVSVDVMTLPMSLAPGADDTRARALVARAHEQCFIGNSVSTPVELAPTFVSTAAPVAAG